MRDIVSGLVVLAVLAWGGPQMRCIVLLIEALVPMSDMSLILAAKGSIGTALGVHGVTAALMIAGAAALLMGA
jgi:hypothetical protein